jgi:hypothetical protein
VGLTYARPYTTKRVMAQNWKTTYTNTSCQHSDQCGCIMTLEGIGKETQGLRWQGQAGQTVKEQLFESALWMNNWAAGEPSISATGDEAYFKARLTTESSIKIITAPVQMRVSHSQDVILPSPHPDVQLCLKRSDFVYFSDKYPEFHVGWEDCERWVWSNTPVRDGVPHTVPEVPPLWALCLRTQSAFHWACGLTNGRPHAISAMANLAPRKLPDAILLFDKKNEPEKSKEALKHTEPALDLMYRFMGLDLSKVREWKCGLSSIKDMFLGASAGLMTAETKSIALSMSEEIRVSNKGKKIDYHEQVLLQILDFLATGKRPTVNWVTPPKNEVFYAFDKQMDDEKWYVFVNKLRVFNIPSAVFIYLERMASLVRHIRERGRVIRIGHRWPRGGGDTIARCLGVDITNCWLKMIVEADFKNFDQTVKNCLIKIYWSQLSVHFDVNSPDYPILEAIVQFLLENMCYRISHLFGNVWGIIQNSIASGKFNTSHEDSWVVIFLYSLFCINTLMSLPLDKQEEAELFIMSLKFICYGDDHLYNKWIDSQSPLFSGDRWARFCEEFFGMNLRDIKDGVSFCSETKRGWIIKMGCSFLKHQFVLNPVRSDGQCTFLPFRESREYLVRAVYSREPKVRDSLDVMLSVLGQAHSTYASNRDAYDRLFYLYSELLNLYVDPEDLDQKLLSRLGQDDIKRIRQMNMEPEELIGGFPSWEQLVSKNVYDPVYQEISKNDYEEADLGLDVEGFY